MISSLLGQKRPSVATRSRRRSPLSSSFIDRASLLGRPRPGFAQRQRLARYAHSEDGDDHNEDDEDVDEEGSEGDEDDGDVEDEDGDEDEDDEDEDEDHAGVNSPLLPLFEASHLDSLPVYSLTHTIRLLVISRCETTLSWDQLRSPQVSQFLVKPIQTEVTASHFSRATLYALLSNCLQFTKEAASNPANSGVSKTRAMACELLAIKLLKDYTARELVFKLPMYSLSPDALSYDFYPLQGFVPEKPLDPALNQSLRQKAQPRMARISTLEVAIMAQAKRFLAHPVVVQHLEAIWAGTVVFHSASDNLHRRPSTPLSLFGTKYGAAGSSQALLSAGQQHAKNESTEPASVTVRRSVTLYDPRHASLFKLSRLRVPRYRQFLSTCSLAVLLVLFVAVLAERSTKISTLEIVFWLWSAGFMLDEVVGFNEQGFSLYIMSFWNSFDLGILLVLVCFYCLRIAALLVPAADQAHLASTAYDILALNAILLFPRLFSVLDHYRYFSQLLIAFRMMVMDLIAVFILIVIACSGFFVAFLFSFGNEEDDSIDGSSIAYALLQMVLGFTPTAWEAWGRYNVIGRVALLTFLFITHYLIVTILITVLTNSFMAIVQNANDEHQFVFAVNTISMVKSDALFSYIAPTNVIEWTLSPLRHLMSFRAFVRLNRTTIKTTHFPVLLVIFAYERVILSGNFIEPTDLIRRKSKATRQLKAFQQGDEPPPYEARGGRLRRERSVATFQQDRALDEVFRRPFREDSYRQGQRTEHRQRKTSNVVNKWMRDIGPDGHASPPDEQDANILERLERPGRRRASSRGARDPTTGTRSVASDPVESMAGPRERQASRSASPGERETSPRRRPDAVPVTTDADGDDEPDEEFWVPESDQDFISPASARLRQIHASQTQLLPVTPRRSTSISFDGSSLRRPSRASQVSSHQPPPRQARPAHHRQLSSNTILFRPVAEPSQPAAADADAALAPTSTASGSAKAGTSPRRPIPGAPTGSPRRPGKRARQRPALPRALPTMPELGGFALLDTPRRVRNRSALALDLASDLGDNKAVGGGLVGAVPASFATQMGWAGGFGGRVPVAARDAQAGARRRPNGGARGAAGGGVAGTGVGAGAVGLGGFATGGFDPRIPPPQAPPLRRGGYDSGDDATQRMSKLMLVRMNNLEAGFREVLQEVRDWRRDRGSVSGGSGVEGRDGGGARRRREGEVGKAKGKGRAEEVESYSDAEVEALRDNADDEEGELRGSSV